MSPEQLDREDYEYDIVSELYDGVTFHRGLGDSGTEIRIVEKECSVCGHDRQIQIIKVHPEEPDSFIYQCQHPNCPDYHDGKIPFVSTL